MQNTQKRSEVDKRYSVTLCNCLTSLVFFIVMFLMYFTSSGDADWKSHSPYEIAGFTIHRSSTAGVFARDPAVPIPAAVIMDTIDTTRIDHAKTKEALLSGIGCETENGARCSCYTRAVTSILTTARIPLDVGDTTWLKTWETIINDTAGCAIMSSSWELQVQDALSKVLMGILVWWAFSIAIIAFHLFIDWERDDWFYKGLALIFGIILPTGIGAFLIYSEEGLMSMWFMLYIAFLVQHIALKVFIMLALSARNDNAEIKNDAATEFSKKNVMSSLTAFAFLSTARLSQLMSGSNDTGTEMNITYTALAIGLLSIALRLICGGLEVFEIDFKDKPAGKAKNDALDHRKGLVFAAQWIWMFTFMLGLMLMTSITVNSGDGLFEGGMVAKISLGLIMGAIVLQYPQLANSHYQWLGLQLLEGMAHLLAGGTVLFYLTKA